MNFVRDHWLWLSMIKIYFQQIIKDDKFECAKIVLFFVLKTKKKYYGIRFSITIFSVKSTFTFKRTIRLIVSCK